MESHYPTIDKPASADYVLAVLQDMHRQQCQIDPEADRDAVLMFKTTVEEWREACDLLGTRGLGRGMNDWFGLDLLNAQWKSVLEPARQRRLSDVCALIAGCLQRPVVRPANIFGNRCTAAGVFLTIRSYLVEAGAAAHEIRPSSPLAPFARRFSEVFLGPIARLAPGVLPPVRMHTPLYNAATFGMLVPFAAFIAAACCGMYWLATASMAAFFGSVALQRYLARHTLPYRVAFGELQTFRDLATVIAESIEDDGGGDC